MFCKILPSTLHPGEDGPQCILGYKFILWLLGSNTDWSTLPFAYLTQINVSEGEKYILHITEDILRQSFVPAKHFHAEALIS